MVSVCGVVHYNTVAPACRLADAFLWRTCHTVLAGLLGWHQNPLGRCAVVPRRLAAQHAARRREQGTPFLWSPRLQNNLRGPSQNGEGHRRDDESIGHNP